MTPRNEIEQKIVKRRKNACRRVCRSKKKDPNRPCFFRLRLSLLHIKDTDTVAAKARKDAPPSLLSLKFAIVCFSFKQPTNQSIDRGIYPPQNTTETDLPHQKKD
jgi:hypothetical protein